MPNKTSAFQSSDLTSTSVKVFDELLNLTRFQIPPLPITHTVINPNANDLELDLLMFYFESVNHPVTESDLQIIYSLTNNEYSLNEGKNPFEGLPLSFEVNEHNLEVITLALKIAASRLGFAAAMACNSKSFLSDTAPQINTAKWYHFLCCFKPSAVPSINTAEIKMKLVARYLMTFFFLDDVLEKNNASDELLSTVESIFKNRLPKIELKNKKDAVILRMVQNVVNGVRDLLNAEFPNMSGQLYNQFIESYFEQAKSVVEECRQKKMYKSGHYPENELFFINRTLTIGYYPLVKLVDSLLGVYESHSNLLVKMLDDIGARRLHLINGLLSFEVEMSELLPKNKLTGEDDFDLNKTAHELFELVNKSDFNTPTDAFTNELLVYSLNHNVSIREAIHKKMVEYNNLGHNALIISCELLKNINSNRHRFSDQFIEAVMMRIKFNLVEAEDYHLLTARYRLSREVNFELQGHLMSGKLRKGGDFSLEEFTNKFTLTQLISEETLIAQHERINRLFYGLTANSQLRMDQIESFIQLDSTIITFDRNQKNDLDPYSNYCIYGPPGIGKSAFVKSFVDYKRTLWLSAKDLSTVKSVIQLFNLKNKSDLNCFLAFLRVHFDFLVIDAIETLPENHMFLNDLINHFKKHGCSILLTSQQKLLRLPDSFKPLELEPVDLKDLASNTSGLNEVPSVLIPIIQIPLYFKFFVEFKDLIASGKFDLFDADSLEPFFPSTVLKDFLLEFKLAASIDYNSKKHVLNKEAFQVILIKLLKRQFLFEEITFTKKESLFLDEYKRIGILNEKGKFTLNTYLEYAWRSFFDHELNHGVSIKRIESIFKVFPESYYLFIPFIGKLKEVGLYDKFISSTKIWDTFDTRIMVLRSICNTVKNETWLNARQITIPEYFNGIKPYFHPKRREIKSLLFNFLYDLFIMPQFNIDADDDSLCSDQSQASALEDFSHLDSYWDDLREQFTAGGVDQDYVKQLIDNQDDLKESLKDYKIDAFDATDRLVYATYDDLTTHLNRYFELIDSAFKIASYDEKVNLLSSIIKLKPSLVKDTNDYTEGVLHIAIEQKQYLLIRMMCTMFPDALNDSDFFDDTPLHSLAYWFQFEKTDKLIEIYDLLSEYSSQTKNKFGMTPDFIRAIWDIEFRQIKQKSIPEDLWFNSPNYYLDKEIESASFDLDKSNDTDEDC